MKNKTGGTVQIAGDSGDHLADVDLINGIKRLRTDATVTVEEIFGQDPFPDSYFEILTAGDENDTWRIQVAGVTDPTATERTLPAVDYTYTVTAAAADKEMDVRDAIIAGLNADTNFINAELKAQKARDIPVVHITSRLRSMTGEYYERTNSGDFAVTTTGTATLTLGYDNLISRGKSTSLARDPDSPHRLGILGISGSVVTTPAGIGGQYEELLTNGSSSDMQVNGSVTPVTFNILADTGNFDTYILGISFHGQGSGIKFANFLSQNAPLTNGILVKLTSEEGTEYKEFLPIYSTSDFKFSWTKGLVTNFAVHYAAADDDLVATKVFENPVPLRAGSIDKIEVVIRDDLSSGISHLSCLANGFRREA